MVEYPKHPLLRCACGGLLAAIAVGARWSTGFASDILPISFLYPAILIADIAWGTLSGLTALGLGAVLVNQLILRDASPTTATANLLGFLFVSLVLLGVGEAYRRAEARRVKGLRQHAAQQELFAREFAHRSRNLLTVAQALISQTVQDPQQRRDIRQRLEALGAAQDLLGEVGTETVPLEDLINAAIAPFRKGQNFEVRTTDCVVRPQQATWLLLALHELATNAMKYGALSDSKGRVCISVEEDKGGLKLHWSEEKGPAVTPPERCGFGSKLLKRAQANVQFLPDGISCEIPRIHCVA